MLQVLSAHGVSNCILSIFLKFSSAQSQHNNLILWYVIFWYTSILRNFERKVRDS